MITSPISPEEKCDSQLILQIAVMSGLPRCHYRCEPCLWWKIGGANLRWRWAMPLFHWRIYQRCL